MINKPILLRLTALLLPVFLVLALPACGKKGNPVPRQASRSFVWQDVQIMPLNRCLAVEAVMSGVYTNLDSVILELSAVNSEEDCPGCPFITTETYITENLPKKFDSTNGVVTFSYCPDKPVAKAYRARLIGTSIFDTSRHAVSPELFVIMQ